jgi:uncharacterized protein with GYD domain
MVESTSRDHSTFVAHVTLQEEQAQNVQEFMSVFGAIQNDLEDLGCELQDTYALLGQHDFLFVYDAPSEAEAVQASVTMERRGLDVETSTAFRAAEMSKLVEEV